MSLTIKHVRTQINLIWISNTTTYTRTLKQPKCYGHRDKIPIYLYMKNKYNASVIHHIWIPYSNGLMLKTKFLMDASHYNTISTR